MSFSFTCPGCNTACKLKVPAQLPDFPGIAVPIPKFPPDFDIPDLPTWPTLPNPLFDFSKICPSSGKKD
jgi:hypothetical protein